MLTALNTNGEKIYAQKGVLGFCNGCKNEVTPRCGEINIDHWAHQKDKDCDSWYQPESEWHLAWKQSFNINNIEVFVKKNSIQHRADVHFKDCNLTIEFQNSPISAKAIKEREEFYGEGLIWVINGKKLANGLRDIKNFPKGIYFNSGWYIRLPYGLDSKLNDIIVKSGYRTMFDSCTFYKYIPQNEIYLDFRLIEYLLNEIFVRWDGPLYSIIGKFDIPFFWNNKTWDLAKGRFLLILKKMGY